jgi:hypothetical protein
LKARIVITPGHQLTVFVDEGTFEEASAAAKNLVSQLGAVVVSAGEPEQHRHDPDVKHVYGETSFRLEGHGHTY